jgi:hypothetical protein
MSDSFTTFMHRLSRNSGSLNFLEPYGPVQACTGIATAYCTQQFLSLHINTLMTKVATINHLPLHIHAT